MRTQSRIQRRYAFTLVELLVVLGIISVLLAILMPALVGVRKKAQAVVCAANLRSIGQALTMYTQRYDHYPACYVHGPSTLYAIWPVRLRLFTGGEQGVFYCPAQDERCEWKKVTPAPGVPGRATDEHARFGYEVGEPLLDQTGTYFSYGYNGLGATGYDFGLGHERHAGLGDVLLMRPLPTERRRELRANRVRKPAEMIAITDAYGDGTGDFGVKPNAYHAHVAPGPVHNRGSNVLFCDGHVQWYGQKDLHVTYDRYVESEDQVRRMWNNHNRLDTGTGNPF